MEEDFDIKMEQYALICFFVWKGKILSETIDELCNVYTKDELMLAPTIYQWHEAYQKGRQSFTLQKSSGWLVSEIA